MRSINVAIIGHRFMGRAHSAAWTDVTRFFDVPFEPVLQVACGRDEKAVSAFAKRWGWRSVDTDWRRVVERKDVDVVDISTPTSLHAEIAVAAAAAGKHIFCEKPLAIDLPAAERMLEAVVNAGVVHYLNHNYRRAPAVAYAKALIDAGKVGTVYHWRGAYLQDWLVNPASPMTWHLKRELAGAGPVIDLGSHSIDLARYLIGDIQSVSAMTAQFVAERPGSRSPARASGGASLSSPGETIQKESVTVEDAGIMLARFRNGALGTFSASRFAGGRRNANEFEIYGRDGSVSFDLERMNELKYYSGSDPEGEQGFRRILVTDRSHPYMTSWWPPGHIIGYAETFVHAVTDFLAAVAGERVIEPNFFDGVEETRVIDAALESAKSGRTVQVSE